MKDDPLDGEADASTIAEAVRTGDVHPRAVAEAAIERVVEADASLNFLVAERFERALTEADSIDVSAPLAGVPILLKDFLATCAGMPQTDGSRYPGDWIAPDDSEYVARLKRAGASVLGIVSTPELALLSTCEPHRYGATLNPHARELTTGGSSGAAAAAVASRAVPAAHGNDAGGSLRIPASCCGLMGLKPTRGRNPLGPAHGDLSAGLWVEHVLTRTARDSAAFLDATHGPARGDPYFAPVPSRRFADALSGLSAPMRVAVSFDTPYGARVDPECVTAVERTCAVLEASGHELVEAAPDFDVATGEQDFFDLLCAGTAARIDEWAARLGRPPRGNDLEPYSQRIVELGRAVTGPGLLGIVSRLQRTARRVAAFYEDFDLLLTPTLATPPVPLGYFDIGPGETADDVLARDAGFTPFLWIANVTGQPALSYPAHQTEAGAPVGVHLTARTGEEAALLVIATQLEQHLPPPRRPAPTTSALS